MFIYKYRALYNIVCHMLYMNTRVVDAIVHIMVKLSGT